MCDSISQADYDAGSALRNTKLQRAGGLSSRALAACCGQSIVSDRLSVGNCAPLVRRSLLRAAGKSDLYVGS